MTGQPLIIGLNSQRGKSGKDTLYDLIAAESVATKRFAFGDELKEKCSEAISYTELMQKEMNIAMHDQTLKDLPMMVLRGSNIAESDYKMWLLVNEFDMNIPRSPRFHLQQYGNGYVRDFLKDEDRWLNSVRDKLKYYPNVNIVITDVRQPNELEWIRSIGGTVVRVARGWEIPEVDSLPLHITDTALDDAGLPVIINEWGNPNGMLEQLKEIIKHE